MPIGVSIGYVRANESRFLFDLDVEISCSDSYEAELLAASRLVAACMQLYTKIFIAHFLGHGSSQFRRLFHFSFHCEDYALGAGGLVQLEALDSAVSLFIIGHRDWGVTPRLARR